MKSSFLVYYLQCFLLGLLLFSCASTRQSESTLDNGLTYDTKTFTSLDLDYSFHYPSNWYIFELDEEIRVSNSRERLAFPENSLPIDRDDGFLSSLSVSTVEEIKTLYLGLHALVQEHLLPFSSVEDIDQDSFLPIQSVSEQNIQNIQKISFDYFNLEINPAVEYAYSKELNMLIVKETKKRVILIMSNLLDSELITILNLSYYNNIYSVDNMKKAINLVGSVSLKEEV